MKLKSKDIAVFAVLAALMFASKKAMELIPNVHLLGMFIVSITAIYRSYSLIPIYVYVFLDGIFGGFSTWWVPYLYIWAVLWAFTMLVPKKLPEKIKFGLYIGASALHGFLYGTLYAPAHALIFGLDFKGMISWIITGLPFDITHGVSNLILGFLIPPMILIIKKIRPTER